MHLFWNGRVYTMCTKSCRQYWMAHGGCWCAVPVCTYIGHIREVMNRSARTCLTHWVTDPPGPSPERCRRPPATTFASPPVQVCHFGKTWLYRPCIWRRLHLHGVRRPVRYLVLYISRMCTPTGRVVLHRIYEHLWLYYGPWPTQEEAKLRQQKFGDL